MEGKVGTVHTVRRHTSTLKLVSVEASGSGAMCLTQLEEAASRFAGKALREKGNGPCRNSNTTHHPPKSSNLVRTESKRRQKKVRRAVFTDHSADQNVCNSKSSSSGRNSYVQHHGLVAWIEPKTKPYNIWVARDEDVAGPQQACCTVIRAWTVPPNQTLVSQSQQWRTNNCTTKIYGGIKYTLQLNKA